jgi:hypothetical protein
VQLTLAVILVAVIAAGHWLEIAEGYKDREILEAACPRLAQKP